MAPRRPAARTWLPLLLAFALAGHAERLAAHGGRAAAHRRADAPRPLLAVALLVAVSARGGATIESKGLPYEEFRTLDVDGDEVLSLAEFLAAFPEAASSFRVEVKHATMFTQADIDDDGMLWLPEFLFAKYHMQDMMDAVHASLDARLPDGFVADINELHWELRKASGGKVALHEILDALRSFIKYEGDFDRDAKPKLEAVFQVVDVIEDGMLNRNEMDLFHFIVRESMVNAALKFGLDPEVAEILQDMPLEPSELWTVFQTFDTNGDGLLDESEVVHGLLAFMGTTRGNEHYQEFVRDLFHSADVGGDQRLGIQEMRALAEFLVNGTR